MHFGERYQFIKHQILLQMVEGIWQVGEGLLREENMMAKTECYATDAKSYHVYYMKIPWLHEAWLERRVSTPPFPTWQTSILWKMADLVAAACARHIWT